jgi:anaerobic ribonucleoside-triphosphate reductase activating protein
MGLDLTGTLRVAGTIGESIVDGPGIRYVIFTQGCPHDCPGCHNPETHDPLGGQEIALQTLYDDIHSRTHVKGVTFSGGEPFAQPAPLARLAEALRADGRHIMCYTGYVWEQLLESADPAVHALLSHIDLLVDGPFIQAERSLDLRFRGSRNQRILDAAASLEAGRPIEAAL